MDIKNRDDRQQPYDPPTLDRLGDIASMTQAAGATGSDGTIGSSAV